VAFHIWHKYPHRQLVDHGLNVEYGKSYEWWKERRGAAPGFRPEFGQHVDRNYDTYEKVLQMGLTLS